MLGTQIPGLPRAVLGRPRDEGGAKTERARSLQVALFLERSGHKKVINLRGGLDAWSRTVDPSLPVY